MFGRNTSRFKPAHARESASVCRLLNKQWGNDPRPSGQVDPASAGAAVAPGVTEGSAVGTA
jgi:hypothetical protein